MPAQPQPFHEWLQDRARERGYDIDAPRGGGRAKLADDSGVSRGQVGRALAGESVPDIGSQRRLAKALRVPLEEMLIRSGLCEADDFPDFTGRPAPQEDSLDEIADDLDATPLERRILRSVLANLIESLRKASVHAPPTPSGAAEGDGYRMRGASPTGGAE